MALGGEQGHVVRMVLQSGLRLLAVGIVTGLVASVATNRLLAGQLWNTSSYDPATLVAVVAVVIFIGACACWIPAYRATRVDPIVSLRHE
jgi:putative ABC transport system permease protein